MTASANLHGLAVEIRAVPYRSLIAVAKAAKQVAAQEGARLGGPLSGAGKRGLKLRARDDIRETADGATVRIQGVSPAGWVWVTTGTKPHRIRRRKRGPKRKMTVPHPGTRGRGGWTAVRERVTRIVPEIFRDEVARVVR